MGTWRLSPTTTETTLKIQVQQTFECIHENTHSASRLYDHIYVSKFKFDQEVTLFVLKNDVIDECQKEKRKPTEGLTGRIVSSPLIHPCNALPDFNQSTSDVQVMTFDPFPVVFPGVHLVSCSGSLLFLWCRDAGELSLWCPSWVSGCWYWPPVAADSDSD